MNSNSMSPRSKRVMIPYVFLVFWAYSLILFVLWSSRNLRPIADDYCIATSVQNGPLAAMGFWWRGWSGDMSTMFANVVLVGWPLQELKWSLGSSLPFIASCLMVTIFLTTIVRASVIGKFSNSTFRTFSTIPFFLLSWWTFWWINKIQNPESVQFVATANATTLWQNVNTSYVFISSLIMLLLYVIYVRSKKYEGSKWNFAFFSLSGIFVGFSGAVLSAAILTYFMLLPIGTWLDGKRITTRNLSLWITFNLAMVTSAVLSYFSPGTRYRATFFPNAPEINLEIISAFRPTIIPSLLDWWRVLFSQGMFATIVMVLVIAIIQVWRGYEFENKFLQKIAVRVIVFSLILSVVVGFSELFTQEAYYHRIPVYLALWIGVMLLAVSCSSHLTRLSPNLSQIVFVSALGMAISTLAVFTMTDEISKRYEMWQDGPAPVAHIKDIEEDPGWQRDCYLALIMQRSGPAR